MKKFYSRLLVVLAFLSPFTTMGQNPFATSIYKWASRNTGSGDDRTIQVTTDAEQCTYSLITIEGTASFGAFSLPAPSKSLALVKYGPTGQAIWGRVIGTASALNAASFTVSRAASIYTDAVGTTHLMAVANTTTAVGSGSVTVAAGKKAVVYTQFNRYGTQGVVTLLAEADDVGKPSFKSCTRLDNGKVYVAFQTTGSYMKNALYNIPTQPSKLIPWIFRLTPAGVLTSEYLAPRGATSISGNMLATYDAITSRKNVLYAGGTYYDSIYFARPGGFVGRSAYWGASGQQLENQFVLKANGGASPAIGTEFYPFDNEFATPSGFQPSFSEIRDIEPRKDTGIYVIRLSQQSATVGTEEDYWSITNLHRIFGGNALPNPMLRSQLYTTSAGTDTRSMYYFNHVRVLSDNTALLTGVIDPAGYTPNALDGDYSKTYCVTKIDAAGAYKGSFTVDGMTLAVPTADNGGFVCNGNLFGAQSYPPLTLAAPGNSPVPDAYAARYGSTGPAAAAITAISPASGPVGTLVTITGNGFTSVGRVDFNGVPATSFTLVNSTTITATVPTGATTGYVQVIAGTGWPVAPTNFTVTTPSNWPVSFGGGSDDYVRGVVRDPSTGGLFVSISWRGLINFMGFNIQSTSNTRRDMALVAVSNEGELIWMRQVGNGVFDMEPQGVNVDGSGYVYWAGSYAGSIQFLTGDDQAPINRTASGSYDAFVAKFHPSSANCLWAKSVGGPGNDYLYGCFVSNSGNVYAGGSYTGSINFLVGEGGTSSSISLPNSGGLDGFIVKYSPAGLGIWASRFGSAADDEVKSIEYNGGDLVACGYMGNNCVFPSGTNAAPTTTTVPTIGGSRDGWAARINSEGRAVWVKNFGTIFNDEASSICYDPSTGNVFAAAQVADAPVAFNGGSYSGAGGNDIMVVGYNFYSQAPVWARRAGSSSGDSPAIIRWDGNRIVVAGYSGGTINGMAGLGGTDGVVLRYDKNTGVITSANVFGGSGNDRILTMYCNTANREEFLGGVFSGTATLPVGASRTSNGAFDGFLGRMLPPSGARKAAQEPDAPQAIKAYPVPFCNLLSVESGSAVELLDLQGRVQRRAGPVAGMVRFETADLPKGIYLVRTADGKVVRVVKE